MRNFLRREGIWPLLAGSLMAVALLLARFWHTRSLVYGFLAWNLFLAWVPLCATLLGQLPGASRGVRLSLFGVWLAFFPNAPYIVTDLVHLRNVIAPAWWYDATMVFAFAWLGMMLGLRSLAPWHARVERRGGRAAGRAFVVAIALLSGVGIYIGRFLRWNSWDILRDPLGLFADLAQQLATPLVWPRLFGVIGLSAFVLVLCYATVGRPAPES